MTAKRIFLLMIFCLLFLLLTACGTSSSPVAEEPAVTPDTAADTKADGAFEDSECYSVIKNTIETAFDALHPEISYNAEDSLIEILFVAPSGTANAMVMDKNAIREDWMTLCDNLSEVSRVAYEACESEGYRVGCTVMILSDSNTENTFFAAMNGEVFYNIIDDE